MANHADMTKRKLNNMRVPLLSISVLTLVGLSTPVFAIDSAEQVIMKCRVNALSVQEQVTCLEEALRARSPSETAPNWSGITESGQMPAQIPNAASPQVGGTYYTPDRPTGLGSEQVRIEGTGRDARRAANAAAERSRVVDFAYNSKGSLIVILSNGQVWKQRDGDIRSVDLEDGAEPAVIVRKGAVSGYRMSFPDKNSEITVSRIR